MRVKNVFQNIHGATFDVEIYTRNMSITNLWVCFLNT